MSGENILTNIVHRYGTNTRGNNCTNICTNRKQIHVTGNNCTTNLTTSVALRETKQLPTKGDFSNRDSIWGKNHQIISDFIYCGFHFHCVFSS